MSGLEPFDPVTTFSPHSEGDVPLHDVQDSDGRENSEEAVVQALAELFDSEPPCPSPVAEDRDSGATPETPDRYLRSPSGLQTETPGPRLSVLEEQSAREPQGEPAPSAPPIVINNNLEFRNQNSGDLGSEWSWIHLCIVLLALFGFGTVLGHALTMIYGIFSYFVPDYQDAETAEESTPEDPVEEQPSASETSVLDFSAFVTFLRMTQEIVMLLTPVASKIR